MFFAAMFLISVIFGITAVLNWFAGQEVTMLHWIIGLPGLIVFVIAIPGALNRD